ncbi:undecaprenyl diphosphate synthase family protein [Streptomyces albidoflavus]|uniref:undecaprenyl diphosphate synthase family protein n=1 Tax=Streptomyces albidoflavus TaxID=1886 RepID=UPI003CF6E62E
MARAERKTAHRTGTTVCFGIGYDGHDDIRRAFYQAAAAPDRDGAVCLPVDEYLTTSGLPALDLVVRTSGERRLSGFLLWQSADATLHLEDRMWPSLFRQSLCPAQVVFRSARIRLRGVSPRFRTWCRVGAESHVPPVGRGCGERAATRRSE